MLSKAKSLAVKATLVFFTALVPVLAFGQFIRGPISPSVTVSETSVPAGSTFEITADFRLAKGVHLYKDEISFQWEKLVGAQHLETVFPEAKKVPDVFGPDRNAVIEIYEGSVRIIVRMKSIGKEGDPITISGKLAYRGCTDQVCYPPATTPIQFDLTAVAAPPEEKPTAELEKARPTVSPKEKGEQAPRQKGRGAIWLILMSFGAGIGISLTPCVYPMIPVTAAVIGSAKQKGKLRALFSSMVYVLGLSITYSLLGLLVASGGARVRTWLASPWVLVPIGAVFVVLALSMFEVISIQIQPKSVTKLQTALSGKGRMLAIFAMGILSGLIAGPCITAPLAGILVIVAKEANRLLGFFMLFALAWGMGIILIVAGTLTSALPQAGEWTVWVKKLLGFVMLWAAVYFVSPVIGSAAYRAATALILLAAAVLLGGFDTLTKESGFGDRAKRFAGLVAVMAAVYLLAGVVMKSERWGPTDTSRGGEYPRRGGTAAPGPFQKAGYDDVKKALASGRPVVLDFFADWCRICDKLDAKTFSDPRVISALERLEALKVDFDREPRLVEEFKVFGPPTIVLIGSDGKEIENLRFFGFKDAEDFLKVLENVN